MNITITQDGRRVYFSGNTYPHRAAISAIGAHWDGDRKAWWTAKKAAAEALVAQISAVDAEVAGPEKKEVDVPGDGATVAGRAEYKGKAYFIAGRVERGRTSYDDKVLDR